MISHAKPAPDDTPNPEHTTPKRIAAELLAIAQRASQLRIRARSLALYLAPEPDDAQPTARTCLDALGARLGESADRAVDLAMAIRVGQVPLDERYIDPTCRPERPLLDKIEGAPAMRRPEAIAPAVSARPPDDELWAAETALRPPPEHPAASPARQAARRRRGQGEPPLDPAEWNDSDGRARRDKKGVAS